MPYKEITCFKAYDIRGRIPDELNEDIAYRIGRAYAMFLTPKQVVVGHDIRLLSEQFATTIDGPQSPHRRAEAIAL